MKKQSFLLVILGEKYLATFLILQPIWKNTWSFTSLGCCFFFFFKRDKEGNWREKCGLKGMKHRRGKVSQGGALRGRFRAQDTLMTPILVLHRTLPARTSPGSR